MTFHVTPGLHVYIQLAPPKKRSVIEFQPDRFRFSIGHRTVEISACTKHRAFCDLV